MGGGGGKERERKQREGNCVYIFGSLNIKFSWIYNLDIFHTVWFVVTVSFCCPDDFITEGKKDRGSLRTDSGLLFSLSGDFKNHTFFNSFTKLCKYKVKARTDRLDRKEPCEVRSAIHACGICSGKHWNICGPVPRKTNRDVAFFTTLDLLLITTRQTWVPALFSFNTRGRYIHSKIGKRNLF